MKIEHYDLQFKDLFTGKIMYTLPAVSVTNNNGDTLVFCKDKILKKIDEYDKDMTDEAIKEQINVKPEEFHNRMHKLRDFVETLKDEDVARILECLPRYKNGNIKHSAIPVYMTKMTQYNVYSTTSIELHAEPWVVPSNLDLNDPSTCIFAKNTKIDNLFNLNFSTYSRIYDKTDVPVVDGNGNFNVVELKRNSYLKADTLIPGHIYTDAKERDFLYLGAVYSASFNDCWSHIDVKSEIANFQNKKQPKTYSHYAFIQLNDKRKKDITNSATFADWWEPIIEKLAAKNGHYDNNYLKIADSFKVCEDNGIAFDLDKMECDIYNATATKYYNDTDGATTAHTRFIVPCISTKIYHVVLKSFTSKFGTYWDVIAQFNTVDDAKAYIKQKQARCTTTKFKREERYCLATDTITDGELP